MRHTSHRVATFLIMVFLSMGATSQVVSGDQLWNRVLDNYRANSNWFASRLVITAIERNGAGRILSEERAVMRNYLNDEGEDFQEPLLVIRNGEDITEGRREDPNFGQPFGGVSFGEDAFQGLELFPFDPEQADSVTVQRRENRRFVGGRSVVGFDFVHETYGRFSNVGTVWVDAELAMPVRVEGSIRPNPAFVSNFEYEQSFDIRGDVFQATGYQVEAEGGFLFIRRQFSVTLEFSQFERVDVDS